VQLPPTPVDVALSALDAVFVLESVVGTRTLTYEQKLAGDVTGNGGRSAYDAALILQYKVGLITRFPAAQTCGSDWLFVPNPSAIPNQYLIQPELPSTTNPPCQMGGIRYDPLSGTADTQDFTAILLGDVTGNWAPPPP
jgi:hypothetical protein